jgi:hypothetical protein
VTQVAPDYGGVYGVPASSTAPRAELGGGVHRLVATTKRRSAVADSSQDATQPLYAPSAPSSHYVDGVAAS